MITYCCDVLFDRFVGRGVTGDVASIVNITRDPTDSDSAEYRYKHTVEGLTPMTEYCYVIQTVNEGVTSEDRMPPCKILQTDTNGKTLILAILFCCSYQRC